MENREITKRADFQIQAEDAIIWLESVPAQLKDLTIDSLPNAYKRLAQIKILEAAANRFRIQKIQKAAGRAKCECARAIGKVLLTMEKNKGAAQKRTTRSIETTTLADLGITKDESSKWQKIAKIPEYAYQYGLNRPLIPSISTLIEDVNRYFEIKSAVIAVKASKAELKRFIMEGYLYQTVVEELSQSDEDDVPPMDDDEDDTDFEIDVDYEIEKIQTNAATLAYFADEFKTTFSDVESITKQASKSGLAALRQMRDAIVAMKDILIKKETTVSQV
ncbi:MAG: hypothetical protein HN416_11845 [Nitrospina sp.]|jgi:hypothetical protein|nr:hypothetical protein [Nitrospina sp.]